MNSEHKNYPMKEFRTIFSISLISVIKYSFLNISSISKCMGFTKIWVPDLNSECKIYPMKEFRAIFPISLILVCETRSFFNISSISKCMDLHKFGLQIWIQNGKITLWKNFGQFFRFHRSWSSGLRMRKKVIFNISCISLYGIYNNLGCRFEFRTQKLPYERISGKFSDFIDFGHQVGVCETRSFLNISCISRCMGFT